MSVTLAEYNALSLFFSSINGLSPTFLYTNNGGIFIMAKDEMDIDDFGFDTGDELFPLDDDFLSGKERPPKGVKGYLKNAVKSVGRLGVKIGNMWMPEVGNFITSIRPDGTVDRDSIKDTVDTYKEQAKGYIKKYGKEAVDMVKEMKDDYVGALKTGNFFQEKEFDVEAFLGLDGEDSYDYSEDYGDGYSEDDVNYQTAKIQSRATVRSAKGVARATKEAARQQVTATMGAANAQMSQERGLFSQQMVVAAEQHRQKMAVMKNIATNVAKIINQNNMSLKAQMEYSAKSLAMAQDSASLLKEIRNTGWLQIGKGDKKESERYKSAYAKVFGSFFDKDTWLQQVKNQILDQTGASTALDMLHMVTDMGMSPMIMAREMIEDGLLKTITSNMFSSNTKKGMFRLNDLFENAPKAINAKLGGIRDNGGLKMFQKGGRFENFKYGDKVNEAISSLAGMLHMGDYQTGMAGKYKIGDMKAVHPFDNKAHAALTEAIPAFLARIDAGVNGTEVHYFDYKSMQLKTAKSLKDQIKRERDRTFEWSEGVREFQSGANALIHNSDWQKYNIDNVKYQNESGNEEKLTTEEYEKYIDKRSISLMLKNAGTAGIKVDTDLFNSNYFYYDTEQNSWLIRGYNIETIFRDVNLPNGKNNFNDRKNLATMKMLWDTFARSHKNMSSRDQIRLKTSMGDLTNKLNEQSLEAEERYGSINAMHTYETERANIGERQKGLNIKLDKALKRYKDYVKIGPNGEISYKTDAELIFNPASMKARDKARDEINKIQDDVVDMYRESSAVAKEINSKDSWELSNNNTVVQNIFELLLHGIYVKPVDQFPKMGSNDNFDEKRSNWLQLFKNKPDSNIDKMLEEANRREDEYAAQNYRYDKDNDWRLYDSSSYTEERMKNSKLGGAYNALNKAIGKIINPTADWISKNIYDLGEDGTLLDKTKNASSFIKIRSKEELDKLKEEAAQNTETTSMSETSTPSENQIGEMAGKEWSFRTQTDTLQNIFNLLLHGIYVKPVDEFPTRTIDDYNIQKDKWLGIFNTHEKRLQAEREKAETRFDISTGSNVAQSSTSNLSLVNNNVAINDPITNEAVANTNESLKGIWGIKNADGKQFRYRFGEILADPTIAGFTVMNWKLCTTRDQKIDFIKAMYSTGLIKGYDKVMTTLDSNYKYSWEKGAEVVKEVGGDLGKLFKDAKEKVANEGGVIGKLNGIKEVVHDKVVEQALTTIKVNSEGKTLGQKLTETKDVLQELAEAKTVKDKINVINRNADKLFETESLKKAGITRLEKIEEIHPAIGKARNKVSEVYNNVVGKLKESSLSFLFSLPSEAKARKILGEAANILNDDGIPLSEAIAKLPDADRILTELSVFTGKPREAAKHLYKAMKHDAEISAGLQGYKQQLIAFSHGTKVNKLNKNRKQKGLFNQLKNTIKNTIKFGTTRLYNAITAADLKMILGPLYGYRPKGGFLRNPKFLGDVLRNKKYLKLVESLKDCADNKDVARALAVAIKKDKYKELEPYMSGLFMYARDPDMNVDELMDKVGGKQNLVQKIGRFGRDAIRAAKSLFFGKGSKKYDETGDELGKLGNIAVKVGDKTITLQEAFNNTNIKNGEKKRLRNTKDDYSKATQLINICNKYPDTLGPFVDPLERYIDGESIGEINGDTGLFGAFKGAITGSSAFRAAKKKVKSSRFLFGDKAESDDGHDATGVNTQGEMDAERKSAAKEKSMFSKFEKMFGKLFKKQAKDIGKETNAEMTKSGGFLDNLQTALTGGGSGGLIGGLLNKVTGGKLGNFASNLAGKKGIAGIAGNVLKFIPGFSGAAGAAVGASGAAAGAAGAGAAAAGTAGIAGGATGLLGKFLGVVKTCLTSIFKSNNALKNLGSGAINTVMGLFKGASGCINQITTKISGFLAGLTTLPVQIAKVSAFFAKGMLTAKKDYGIGKGMSVTPGMRIMSGLTGALNGFFNGIPGIISQVVFKKRLATWLFEKIGSAEDKAAILRYKKFNEKRALIMGIQDPEKLIAFENRDLMFGAGKAGRAILNKLSFGMVQSNDSKDAQMLGFNAVNIFSYWKTNKYTPLDDLRKQIAEQFGGLKVVEKMYSPKIGNDVDGDGMISEEEENEVDQQQLDAMSNQNDYWKAYLKAALQWVKDNKMAWLTNKTSEKEFEERTGEKAGAKPGEEAKLSRKKVGKTLLTGGAAALGFAIGGPLGAMAAAMIVNKDLRKKVVNNAKQFVGSVKDDVVKAVKGVQKLIFGGSKTENAVGMSKGAKEEAELAGIKASDINVGLSEEFIKATADFEKAINKGLTNRAVSKDHNNSPTMFKSIGAVIAIMKLYAKEHESFQDEFVQNQQNLDKNLIIKEFKDGFKKPQDVLGVELTDNTLWNSNMKIAAGVIAIFNKFCPMADSAVKAKKGYGLNRFLFKYIVENSSVIKTDFDGFMNDRANILGVEMDKMLAWESKMHPTVEKPQTKEEAEKASTKGKFKGAIFGAIKGFLLGNVVGAVIGGATALFGGERRMGNMLGFTNTEIYKFWKKNKYDPIRKLEEDIALEFGNIDDLSRRDTEDPELQKRFYNKFLPKAKRFVKENNLEWLTSKTTKKEFDARKNTVQKNIVIDPETGQVSKSSEPQKQGVFGWLKNKITGGVDTRGSAAIQTGAVTKSGGTSFGNYVNMDEADKQYIADRIKSMYNYSEKTTAIIASGTAEVHGFWESIDPAFYQKEGAFGKAENTTPTPMPDTIGQKGGPDSVGEGLIVTTRDAPDKGRIGANSKSGQAAADRGDVFNTLRNVGSKIAAKARLKDSATTNIAENINKQMIEKLAILEKMHAEQLRHDDVSEKFFVAAISLLTEIARKTGVAPQESYSPYKAEMSRLINQIIK